MRLGHWRTAVCLLFLTACAVSAPAAESTVEAIKKRGILRVAMFGGDTPPFYFKSKDTGEMVGFDVDLAESLAGMLGVKAKIQRYGPPFAKVTDAVDNGEADILISYASLTPQRREQYACVTYDDTHFALLLDIPRLEKATGREIVEPSDLNFPDVKISVQGHTPFEAILKKAFPNATPEPVETNNDVGVMTKAMDEGKFFVSFDRELIFLIYKRTNPQDFARYQLYVFKDILNPAGMMMPKGSDLAPLVQEYVDNRLEVMELGDIIDKYMRFDK